MVHGGIDLMCDDERWERWSIDGIRRDEERWDDREESPCVQGQRAVGRVYLSLVEGLGHRIVLEGVLRDLLGRELRNCRLTLQDLLEQMQSEVRLFVAEIVLVVVVRESFHCSCSQAEQDSQVVQQEDWTVVAVPVSSVEQEEEHSQEVEVSVEWLLEPV